MASPIPVSKPGCPATPSPTLLAQTDQLWLPLTQRHKAKIWTKENRVSSGNKVKEATITVLDPAKEPQGIWAKVDGQTKLNGVFKYEPFQPDSTVTNDGFDQVQLFNSLTSLAVYLNQLGFDMKTIIGRSKNGRIVAHANKVSDMNAWYSPQTEEQTYGRSNDKWHLAGDNDITKHETGHFILDRYHPGLTGWYAKEGGAIHEGDADSMAALFHDDPEIGEDYPPAIGKPEDAKTGLRTVNNDLALKDVGREVHARGKVYGGFFWSLKKTLEDKTGKYKQLSRQAADIALRILVNHGAFYTTTSPKPIDFVRAVLNSGQALAQTKKGLGVSWKHFRQDVINEAIRRGMIKNASELEEKPVLPEPVARLDAKLRMVFADQAIIREAEIVNAYNKLSPMMNFAGVPAKTVTAIGGSRKAYQQWYMLRQRRGLAPGRVRVVGAGFFVHHDAAGRLHDVSSQDITIIRQGDINETIRYRAHQAVEGVRRRASREKNAARTKQAQFLKGEIRKCLGLQRLPKEISELEKLFLESAKVPADRKIEYRKYQMATRIATVAVERATKLRTKDAKLVIIPKKGKENTYERDLYYEFKMGLSLYYVNARTGRIKVEEDVLWM